MYLSDLRFSKFAQNTISTSRFEGINLNVRYKIPTGTNPSLNVGNKHVILRNSYCKCIAFAVTVTYITVIMRQIIFNHKNNQFQWKLSSVEQSRPSLRDVNESLDEGSSSPPPSHWTSVLMFWLMWLTTWLNPCFHVIKPEKHTGLALRIAWTIYGSIEISEVGIGWKMTKILDFSTVRNMEQK